MTHIAEVPEMCIGLFFIITPSATVFIVCIVQCSQRDLLTVGLSVTISVN